MLNRACMCPHRDARGGDGGEKGAGLITEAHTVAGASSGLYPDSR